MSAATDGLQVDTPTNVVQCQTVVLSWRGSTFPYLPTIICNDGLHTGPVNPQNQTTFTWQVDTYDTSPINCTLLVTDGLGQSASSGLFIVTPGPPGCLLTAGAATESPATSAQSQTYPVVSFQSSITLGSTNSASTPPLSSSSSSIRSAPPFALPSAPSSSNLSGHRHSPRAALYAGIVGGLVCLLVVLVACWHFLIRQKREYRPRDRVSIDGDHDTHLGAQDTGPGFGPPTAGIKESRAYLPPGSFTDIQEWSPETLFVEAARKKPQVPSEVMATLVEAETPTSASEPGMTPEQLAIFQSLISSNAPREAVASVIQMVTGGGVPGSSSGGPPPRYAER